MGKTELERLTVLETKIDFLVVMMGNHLKTHDKITTGLITSIGLALALSIIKWYVGF